MSGSELLPRKSNVCVTCSTADNLSVDLKKLMGHKDKTVRGLTSGIEHLFKKNNVTYVKGKGSLKVPTRGWSL